MSIVLQGDKIPDELPDELQPDKVPKPLSALPSLNGTTPKVLNAAFAFVLCLILLIPNWQEMLYILISI